MKALIGFAKFIAATMFFAVWFHLVFFAHLG